MANGLAPALLFSIVIVGASACGSSTSDNSSSPAGHGGDLLRNAGTGGRGGASATGGTIAAAGSASGAVDAGEGGALSSAGAAGAAGGGEGGESGHVGEGGEAGVVATPVSNVTCPALTQAGCLDTYVGHWTCGGEDVSSSSTLDTKLPAATGGHKIIDIHADGRVDAHQTAYAVADEVHCFRCDGTGSIAGYAYSLQSYVFGDILKSDIKDGTLREFTTWCVGSESECAGAPQGWSRWDCVR